ncbi:hypothetical protein Enr10x_08830 [Gimesia panareensis]|uniref:OstA-like protein n=1 Tax=Gimesia panareensis TaxID=2527978 RepID=A0A517Q1U7_9PLAN|nr:hypothetical protein [Gimesia panareensis]QDT25586.1 hypothetical protein Enr10x_08830 [Gimesia panareensis]
MRNYVFSSCLSALSILALSVSGLAAEKAAEESKPGPSHEVHSLRLQGIDLKAEEIDYKIQRGGRREINLNGQAMIQIDQITVRANSIHAVYTALDQLVLELQEHVSIVSPGDHLRAKATEAKFDFGAKTLLLKGREDKLAQLNRYEGSRVNQLIATEIQIQFTDQETVFIKSSGPVEISERKQTPEDDFPVLQQPRNDPFPGPAPDYAPRKAQTSFSPQTDLFSPSSRPAPRTRKDF